jgi:bacillopeptidase F
MNMKKSLLSVVVWMVCSLMAVAQSAFIEQGLLNWLDQAEDSDETAILLKMEDRVELQELKASFAINGTPVSERPRLVMQALKEKAEASQSQLKTDLFFNNIEISKIHFFWINNSVALTATKESILWLADYSGIERMDLDAAIYGLVEPKKVSGQPKSEGGIEPGLAAINAPAMWALGYTGHGRVAMTFDTGVWTDHPSHSDRFLANLMPLQTTWFGYDLELPGDKESSHGTHVTGIMLGLDSETADTIGVAPQAYFIATDPIVSNIANVKPLSELMLAYEWAMNPDGDESTSDDVPDVINNSWGRSNDVEDQDWDVCPDFVAEVYTALEAAGIANVCSAGNEGPNDQTIGVPHNINTGLVNSFTVGALNGNSGSLPIADFSSRGPSICGGEGSLLIKPEVSAPGVSVRSSIENGDYDFFSGTSMAAPHVSGAVLLLKEAYPEASGEEILMALYLSATDLGLPGEDNTFGSGIIDVFAAYQYLTDSYIPTPPQTFVRDVEIVEVVSPNQELSCLGEGLHLITPVILLRNNADEAVSGLTIRASINEGAETIFEYNETLEGGQVVELTLPEVSYSGEGIKELHVQVDELEEEYDKFNNNAISRWTELNSSTASGTNFFEDFTNGIQEDVWFVRNEDAGITWDTLVVLQSDGTQGPAAWMNHPEYLQIESQKDYLVTPSLDVSDGDGSNYNLVYDYYYRKRTSNSFQQDTFAVYLNQVCDDGLESIELLRKAGEELYTNPNSQQNAFPESPDEWVQEVIPLENLDPSSTYFISFATRNRRGNNLLLDNIMVTNSLGVRSIEKVDFSIYPNPTTGEFTVKSPGSENIEFITIFDITGRQILAERINAPIYQVAKSSFSRGIYIVQVALDNGETGSKRLVIQ